MKKLGLAGSGTSTKLPFSFGVSYELYKLGVLPDLYNGCSGQAIINLFYASEQFTDEVINKVLDFQSRDVFNIAPVNDEGDLTAHAIARLIFMYPSLGKQDNLRHTIKKYFKPEHMDIIRKKNRKVFATSVSFNTKQTYYKNIGDTPEHYNKAIKDTEASAAIPIAVMPVIGITPDGRVEYLYDGGVSDHNGGKQLARRKDVDTLITIWSRPDIIWKYNKMKELEFAGKAHTEAYRELSQFEEWIPKNVLNVQLRLNDVRTFITSIEDEEHIDLLCEKNKINQIKIFPDDKLSDEVYEFDPVLNQELFEHGREKARNAFEKYKHLLS